MSKTRKARSPGSPSSARLLQMQDEKLRRLSRELHDTTGQNLAALQMNLMMLAESARELEPRSRQALADSLTLAQTCVRELRHLSYALYPPLLEEAGLIAALRACTDDYSRRAETPLDLDLPDHLDRLPREVEITLFRIVQEGLAGGPTGVRLHRRPDSVVLELAGLPEPSAARAVADSGGAGERARLLGGRLAVKTGSGGTRLRVVLPLP